MRVAVVGAGPAGSGLACPPAKGGGAGALFDAPHPRGEPRRVAGGARGRPPPPPRREETFDVLVGADGAGSLVRRTLLGPVPPERLAVAAGWFARGDAPMVGRFVPGVAGYLWLFPRPDHVGVGICAPLGALPTRELLHRLEREVLRRFPAPAEQDGGGHAPTPPPPPPPAAPRPGIRGGG